MELRAARKLDPAPHRDLALMGALLHAGKYDAAVKVGEKASASHRRSLLLLSALALRDGVDAARTRASQLASDGNPSLLLMQTTGALLAFRAYPQAVALARSIGFERLGQVGTLLASIGDRLRRTDAVKPGPGALGLVRALVPQATGVAGGSLRRWLTPRLSERIPKDMVFPAFFKVPGAPDTGLAALESMVPGLMGDIANAIAVLEDDGVVGGVHRIRVTTADDEDAGMAYYVVQEKGEPRLLASGRFTAPLGRAALDALDAGHLDDARKLLDWAYQGVTSPPASLPGEPFDGLWGKDQPRKVEDARRAALVLQAVGFHPKPALRPLAALLAHTPKRARKRRDALALALAVGSATAGRTKQAVKLAEGLLTHHDDEAWRRLAFSFALRDHGVKLARGLLRSVGKAHPDERAVVEAREYVAVRRRDLSAATQALKAAVDAGSGDAEVENELANLALFGKIPLHRGLALAKEAVRHSGRKQDSILNTLAVLQAFSGKDAEARHSLLSTHSQP